MEIISNSDELGEETQMVTKEVEKRKVILPVAMQAKGAVNIVPGFFDGLPLLPVVKHSFNIKAIGKAAQLVDHCPC